MTSVNKVIFLEAVQNIRAIAAKQLILPGCAEDVLIICVTCPFETTNLATSSCIVYFWMFKNFNCLVTVIVRIEISEWFYFNRHR